MTCVVAIAAPIGGGKSALTAAIAHALGMAPTLHFDDFEEATRLSPQDLNRWLDSGADFNALPEEALAVKTKNEYSGSGQSAGRDFLVVEMPLGRSFAATAELIDILNWVDTPLDLALARNLRSLLEDEVTGFGGDPEEFRAWLAADLDTYTGILHPILELQKARVAPYAEIVLDGRSPIDAMVEKAVAGIRALL